MKFPGFVWAAGGLDAFWRSRCFAEDTLEEIVVTAGLRSTSVCRAAAECDRDRSRHAAGRGVQHLRTCWD